MWDLFNDGFDGMDLGLTLAIAEEMAEEERLRILEEQESEPPFQDNWDKDDIF